MRIAVLRRANSAAVFLPLASGLDGRSGVNYVADTGLSLSNASTFEFGLGIKQGTTPPSRQTILDSNDPPYYSTYKWPLHTFLHTNFIMLKIMPIMLNYAVYANLYAKFAKLC